MELIDVSVPIVANLPSYPGNTPFQLEPIKRIAEGATSNVSTLHLSAHTGTHVDAPRHFFDDGGGVYRLPLDVLLGRARVVDIKSRAIDVDELSRIDLAGETRVLFRTANSRLWSSTAF